jgi:DNA-binding transcriptional regulator YiaG
MDSLPICKIALKVKKPSNKPYPKELNTIGDQIKKKRLDLNLRQVDLAKLLGVTEDTIRNWEKNRSIPNNGRLFNFTCDN